MKNKQTHQCTAKATLTLITSKYTSIFFEIQCYLWLLFFHFICVHTKSEYYQPKYNLANKFKNKFIPASQHLSL